jgi:DNA-binding CsgD family transcriptional regulator
MSAIAEASSAEAAFGLAMGRFAQLGFPRANYGFTRFRSDRSMGDPDDALFLTTENEAFIRHYFRNNFYARTPVFRWAARNSGARTWTWVKEAYEAGTLTPDEAATVRDNAAVGVVAGVSVSFPETSARSKGALGLIAAKGLDHGHVDALFAEHGAEIVALAHVMHLKLITFPFPTRKRAMTTRQREALEWVADGKTTQDVALLMSVSPAMVEKHLRLAREALDVDTTAQAVAKAALLNLIFQRPTAPSSASVAAR